MCILLYGRIDGFLIIVFYSQTELLRIEILLFTLLEVAVHSLQLVHEVVHSLDLVYYGFVRGLFNHCMQDDLFEGVCCEKLLKD